MLANQTESRTFGANSVIDVDPEKNTATNIAYFSANLNQGNLTFSKTIVNLDLYKLNKETVDKDYDDFVEYVNTEIGV